jgi:chitodextrinase
VTGLDIVSTYTFTVKAVDTAGGIRQFNALVTTTDQTAPTVPAGVAVASITQNQQLGHMECFSRQYRVTAYDYL